MIVYIIILVCSVLLPIVNDTSITDWESYANIMIAVVFYIAGLIDND